MLRACYHPIAASSLLYTTKATWYTLVVCITENSHVPPWCKRAWFNVILQMGFKDKQRSKVIEEEEKKTRFGNFWGGNKSFVESLLLSLHLLVTGRIPCRVHVFTVLFFRNCKSSMFPSFHRSYYIVPFLGNWSIIMINIVNLLLKYWELLQKGMQTKGWNSMKKLHQLTCTEWIITLLYRKQCLVYVDVS